MPKTNLQQHIFIDALPSKVWKVLTNTDYTSQYLSEGTIQCQWTEGSPITIICDREGTEIVHKGKVLQVVPGVLLKYRLQEEAGDAITTATYQLIPAEDGIELKFYSEGFDDADEEYFFRMQQTKLLLQKIKWLAEYA